ncbi:MAG: hypothetical protein ABFR95_06945 [Actinomycetota bacterium]
MSDPVVRAVIVLVLMAVAILLGLAARKVQKPVHPAITVGDVGSRPGVVLFTSTDCSNCRDAIAALEAQSIDFREVTYELEPQRFESWAVLAVPLTVVVDVAGTAVGTFSGVPHQRELARALQEAGIDQR